MKRTNPLAALVLAVTATAATAAWPCMEEPAGAAGASPSPSATAVPTNAQLLIGSDELYVDDQLVLRDETTGAETALSIDGSWPLGRALLPALQKNTPYSVVGLIAADGEQVLAFTTGDGPDHDEPALAKVAHDVSAPTKASSDGCGGGGSSLFSSPFASDVARDLTVSIESEDAAVVELLRVWPDGDPQVTAAAFVVDGRATLKHGLDESAATYQVRATDVAGNEAFSDELDVDAVEGGCAQAKSASATIALLLGLLARRRR